MKIYKITAAAAVILLLAGCGGNKNSVVRLSETEPTTYQTVSGEYTGETDIAVTLPGGDWEIVLDNSNSTTFVQGDKTINASVINDETFEAENLPTTKEEIISRYTTAGGSNIDVLDFSYEETENGTNMLRYTIKYTVGDEVKTLITATEILGSHSVIVVDGVINADADDAEISMMREAVEAAEKISKDK